MKIKGNAVYETDNAQMAINELFLNLSNIDSIKDINIVIINQHNADNKEYPDDAIFFLEFEFKTNKDEKEIIELLNDKLIGFGLENIRVINN